MDIGHVLRLSRSGSSATDTFVIRDVEATVSALVRTNFEDAGFGGSVKARPVKVVKPVMKFADHRGHGGHPIGFTLKKALNLSFIFF